MNNSLGQKICSLRKQRQITQDELAEKMAVSPQAVSKWENDLSIPDLPILIELSNFFNVSLDDLVKSKEDIVYYNPNQDEKDLNQKILKINIKSCDGDIVKVNLPLMLVKVTCEMGKTFSMFGNSSKLDGIDFDMIISLIESGVNGKLVEINSADGDIVEIVVE